MTQPHRYIKNQFVKLSRGTLNGLPLLMPGANGQLYDEIRAIFFREANRFNITLLAFNVEPYGYEAIIFDPDMRRSDLLKSVNQSISMRVKNTIDHNESVWSNRKPGNTPILDLETLENEIFNVCVQPVKKGYVRKVSSWILPKFGPIDWPESIGNGEKAPERSESNAVPLKDFVLIDERLTRGPGSFELAVELAGICEIKEVLIKRIAAFEADEKGRRRRVLGKKSCCKKETFMPRSAQNRDDYSTIKPIVLCACENRVSESILSLKKYYAAYRKALIDFIETKVATFPAGTLKMRTIFRVSILRIEDDDVFHFEI